MNIAASRIFFLILMWWICSTIAEPFFLVAGGLSVWLTYNTAKRMRLLNNESLFQEPLRLFAYLGWLIKEIALAAVGVTRILWQIKPRITPCLFITENHLKHDLPASLYGNSITLTPGTICVDINNKHVQVHALEKAGMADIKSRRMEKTIAKMFVKRKVKAEA